MSYYMMWVDTPRGGVTPEQPEAAPTNRTSWLSSGFWSMLDSIASSRVLSIGSDGDSYIIVEDDAP
jgi:hypothetical protein